VEYVESLKKKVEGYLMQLEHVKTENIELRSKIAAGEKVLNSVSGELQIAREETEKVTIP
jgi:hypothetical protein